MNVEEKLTKRAPLGVFLSSIGAAITTAGRWIRARVRGFGTSLATLARRVRTNTWLARTLRRLADFSLTTLRVSFLTAVTAGLVLGAILLCFQRVPPASIGVLQTQWGGGLVERDFEPGLHFGLRGWQTWHVLDSRTQFAFFGASEQGADSPPLDLRTKEGNEIRVSVVVPYRIVAGHGHLLVRDGLRSTYAMLASATIKDVLMQDFAELTSDDFASTPVRLERVAASLPRLNSLLARFHVEAETIQIHEVDLPQGYENILQKKQLTQQLAMLAKAAAQFEQESRRNTQDQDTVASEMRIRGEMDMEIETLRSKGKLEISQVHTDSREFDFTRRAQAQAEYDRMLAEGDRLLAQAAGLKEKLFNEAYDSPGGRIDLARKGAENLRFKEVVLNANDPRSPTVLDVAQLTGMLLGKKAP